MELFILIFIFITLFVAESIYYCLHALDRLNLKVSFSKRVANCGDDIELIEVAENKKRLPLPFIILKIEVPRALKFYDMTNTSMSDHLYREDMLTVKPFSKHTRRIKAQCTKRGYFVLPRIGITTSDLLLTTRLNRDFPADSSLTVLPDIDDNPKTITFRTDRFSSYAISQEVVRSNTLVIWLVAGAAVALGIALTCMLILIAHQSKYRRARRSK